MQIAQAFLTDSGVGDAPLTFARQSIDATGALFLFGNASASGFETRNEGLSAAMLDVAEGSWTDSAGASGRLDRLFAACARFIDAAPTVAEEGCAGWLTAAWLVRGLLHVQWLGGDEVWLVPEQGPPLRTHGHTLKPMHGAQEAPNVLVRGFGRTYSGSQPEQVPTPWEVGRGDRILMLSRGVVDGVPSDRIVASARATSTQEGVDMLVTMASPARPYALALLACP